MCKGPKRKDDLFIGESDDSRWDNQGRCLQLALCRCRHSLSHARPKLHVRPSWERCTFRLDMDQDQKAEKSQCNEEHLAVAANLSEIYKFRSDMLQTCRLLHFNLILSTVTSPREFSTSIIIPLFKTQNPQDKYSSFKSVGLLCMARNIMMKTTMLGTCRAEFNDAIRPLQMNSGMSAAPLMVFSQRKTSQKMPSLVTGTGAWLC